MPSEHSRTEHASEEAGIESAIAALLAQRALLGDVVVDVAVAPLRARLDALKAGADEPVQTLRHVTILFLDVVGSTQLSQQLDPEDIHALMDGALARYTEVVASFGGKVLQYAGDSLLAVFGHDVAREDDAERAVRAGLSLVDEGRRQGAAILQAHGHAGFDVRVGVHTGNVLLGGGVDAEGTIRGIAVNIAARMEQAAPAGALRVSRDTWRQLRDLFEGAQQAPLDVKGIDQPIVSYLVTGAKARTFDGASSFIEGLQGGDAAPRVAMVGRDAEMRGVTDRVTEARTTHALRMVTVVADAGIGKSRLLSEVERVLATEPGRIYTMHGRAQRHGLDVPYGVIRDMLAWHCDIRDSDAPDVARGKLTRVFGSAFAARADEQSALVGQLIGLDFADDAHIAGIARDGRQIRSRAFHAIAQYLRLRSGTVDLIVLLLDDLHWADDGSLDLIEHLAVTCADLPLVLGCFARPPLFERRPTFGAPSPQASRIVLAPLAEESGARLVDALLARIAEPPPELRALILKSAEGNPFHIEELLAMLVDDGAIVSTPRGWQVDRARLRQIKVPPTLTAVLNARLDALPSREKRALQQDSVIGHVFWAGALQQIAPESVATLDPLAARELIRRHDDSMFAGVDEFAFKHHLLHQVTYDTVLKSTRRELHRRTGDWLVAITGERINEHLGLIADHYERAGERSEAAAYLARAALAANRGAAFELALGYADRALALMPGEPSAAHFELQWARVDSLNSLGRRDAQAAGIDALESAAEALDDDRCRARAARWRSLHCVVTGDYPGSMAAADRAQSLATKVGDSATAGNALLDQSQSLIYLGRNDEAQSSLERALSIARETGQLSQQCVALTRMNILAQRRGDLVAALDYARQAFETGRISGNRRQLAGLTGNLGNVQLLFGLYEAARSLLETSLAESRAIGDRGSEPYPMCTLASIALDEGRAADALQMAEEAARLSREVGDRGSESDCLLLAARCHVALGNVCEAKACLDACERGVRDDAMEAASPASSVVRVDLALLEGRFEEAVSLVERIAAWLEGRRDVNAHDLAHVHACQRVLRDVDPVRADAWLALAWRVLSGQAERVPGAMRSAYLERIPLNRAIGQAWALHGHGSLA